MKFLYNKGFYGPEPERSSVVTELNGDCKRGIYKIPKVNWVSHGMNCLKGKKILKHFHSEKYLVFTDVTVAQCWNK